MNKKIKEIIIKDFRAYKDEQRFNFIHKNSRSVADLVALYAPNGFGKTSFFDAIEWAVTGTIERLNTGKPTKEEVKKEDDYILKNREAIADCSNVTIISEDNGIFSVNTKKKTGNMINDFKPGELVKISKELQTILEEKKSFCTTNLLAHDKITGFLQSYTAEDKTAELKVMWDENNYSEILNDINELYGELEKRKKQLSLDISKEEKELKKYKYENDQNQKVVNSIQRYERKYNENLMNEHLFDVEEMMLLFERFHEISQNEREKKEKECNDSGLLLKEYPTFIDNQKRKCLLQKKKEEYDKAINVWDKIELTKAKQKNIEKEVSQITYLFDKIDIFYDYVEKNNFGIEELRKIEIYKTNYQKKQMITDEKINVLNETLQENNSKLEKLNEKEEQLKQNYSEYNVCELKKKKYAKLYRKAECILEQRNKRIQEWSLYSEQIDLFLEGKLGIGILYDIFPDDIFSKNNLISKLKKERESLIENNCVLENSKNDLIEVYDKVQQLSIKGKEIVNEQKLQDCPLCHMRYQNYEELLEKISEATKENIELEKIDNQLLKNKEREVEIDNELKQLVETIESQVVLIGNEYKEKYVNESKKVKSLQMTVTIWEKTIHEAVSICNKLKEKYQQDKLDLSSYDQVEARMLEIKRQRKEIEKGVEKVLNEIDNEKNVKKELKQNIKDSELKILTIKAENNEISTNQLYLEVKRILEDKEFYNPNFNHCEMKLAIEKRKNQLLDKKNIFDKELEGYPTKDLYSKDEYLMKLNKCQNEINELQVVISGYLLRCEKLFGLVDEEELLKEIEQTNKELQENLKYINEKIQSETSILVGLNRLKEQKMWINKKQSIESNKKNLSLLTKRIDKLQKSKNYVEDYIVNKTNEYFNSDIINQIYNKIDPHPTMKHIKFITQKDKGGLKTHIYTYDESVNNKISPIVYLSSAQVNILSLCIFLSKVLSEKNTTFNTIFIDDPIQHLDGINLLSFIDVLRTITTDLGRQIIISTHNEQFYKLLKVKMDEKYYSSKFIELTSAGKVGD